MLHGFVILSHQPPRSVLRLIQTLNSLYDSPPIACHHDTSQSAIDPTIFPPNVVFVTPSIRTSWGKWSVVEATLSAIRVLYEKSDPDWFTLLSAADYPIAPAAQVRSCLTASEADALIDFREPGMSEHEASSRFGPKNPTLAHFEAPGNREMLSKRYLAAQVWIPTVRQEKQGSRLGRHTFSLPFRAPFLPFSTDFHCYCGDHWFSASRGAAHALMHPTQRELRLQDYLKRRASADECYYQTVLCNRPELKIDRDNRRYARWDGGGAHPKTLNCNDFQTIMASGAHFARKFAPDDPVLDQIDEALLIERVNRGKAW